MKSVRSFLMGVFALWFAGSAAAAPLTLVISSGMKGGGYHRAVTEMVAACPQPGVVYKVLESTGGVANLDSLENNTALMGPMQADSAAYHRQGRDLSDMRVLMPLYPEVALFVTRVKSGVMVGGTSVGGFDLSGVLGGKKELVFQDVSSLRGQTVVAAGGAVDTANYINKFGNVGYQTLPLVGKNSSDALAGVLNGQYLAAVVTGMHPMDLLSSLPVDKAAQLKVLPMSDALVSSLGAYGKMSVSYPNMGHGPGSIPTVSVKSLMVIQNVIDPEMSRAVANFKQCVVSRAPSMAATAGSSVAWRYIAKFPNDTSTAFPMWVPAAVK